MRFIILWMCITLPFGYSIAQSFAKNERDSVFQKPVVLKSRQVTKADLSLYPNPAKNKVTLQVKNFDAGMVMVKIIDTHGKIVREERRLLTNGTEDIIVFLILKAGIYFIMVSEPGKIARKKLVIQ